MPAAVLPAQPKPLIPPEAWPAAPPASVGWLLTLNQLGNVEAGVFWHALTRTGTSSLVHAFASCKQPHRQALARWRRLLQAAGSQAASALHKRRLAALGEETPAPHACHAGAPVPPLKSWPPSCSA